MIEGLYGDCIGGYVVPLMLWLGDKYLIEQDEYPYVADDRDCLYDKKVKTDVTIQKNELGQALVYNP